MAKTSITVGVSIKGLRETLNAFNAMPKNANDELRAASQEIAGELAGDISSSASSFSRQSALLAPTVKARKDRVPSVSVGGSAIVRPGRHHGRKPVKAYQVLFGSEFGAWKDWRFPLPRTPGNRGYWLFPTVKRDQKTMADKWLAAADRVIEKWAR